MSLDAEPAANKEGRRASSSLERTDHMTRTALVSYLSPDTVPNGCTAYDIWGMLNG
jgi:hypothetical protein